MSTEATFDQIQDLLRMKKSFLQQLLGSNGGKSDTPGSISNSASSSSSTSLSGSTSFNFQQPPPPPQPVQQFVHRPPQNLPPIPQSPPIIFPPQPPQIVYVVVQPALPQPIAPPQQFTPNVESNSFGSAQAQGSGTVSLEQQQVQYVTQPPCEQKQQPESYQGSSVASQAQPNNFDFSDANAGSVTSVVQEPQQNYQANQESTVQQQQSNGYLPPISTDQSTSSGQTQSYAASTSSEIIDSIVENVQNRESNGDNSDFIALSAQPSKTFNIPNRRSGRSDQFEIYKIDMNQL